MNKTYLLMFITTTFATYCFCMEPTKKSPHKYDNIRLFWQIHQTKKETDKSGNIITLHLNGAYFHTIASTITSLNHLTELNLSHSNTLTKIPLIIFMLTQLKKLNCTHCAIEHIPESIGNLTNLESLELRNNAIKKIPLALAKLHKLCPTLDLSCNVISSLPDEITELVGLKKINLSYNDLSDLPLSFSRFTNLTDLNISNNKGITRLPSAIPKIRSLKLLSIQQCGLKSLPETICNLTNLTLLTLTNQTHNPFKILPPAIKIILAKESFTVNYIPKTTIEDLTEQYAANIKEGLFKALRENNIRKMALQWHMGVSNRLNVITWQDKNNVPLRHVISDYIECYPLTNKPDILHILCALSRYAHANIVSTLGDLLLIMKNNGILFQKKLCLKRFLAFAYLKPESPA